MKCYIELAVKILCIPLVKYGMVYAMERGLAFLCQENMYSL
jgi:hypothetical protein